MDSTLVASPHAGASPHPPQHSKSQILLLDHHKDEHCCPDSKNTITNKRATLTEQQYLVAPPAHTASSIMRASQAVVCAVFRRCTAPESLSDTEQPAAVRCKPNLLIVLLLQASSSDVVLHHIGNLQATLAAAVRCKQAKPTFMRRPLVAGIILVTATRARQPHRANHLHHPPCRATGGSNP